MAAKRTSNDRKMNKKPLIPRILIVCEGERTEPDYFLQFKVAKVDIEIRGEGMNTLSLVNRAISLKNEANRRKKSFKQVWCVFDLDSFPKQHFEQAIQLAENEKIRVAYSNEAFELWYVLHFDYLQSQMGRKQYITIIEQKLGKKYEKNQTLYHDLFLLQDIAIVNAKRLLEEHHPSHLSPSDKKPSTTVHELVMELKKYIR